ncbi:MAG: DEAD/DEAH box helicase, partial [Pseudomonadota bacterium]
MISQHTRRISAHLTMFATLVENTPWPDQPGSRTAMGPFAGSADARCIAELASEDRFLLVITADSASALTLERELPFYLPESIELLSFPDWETLPYDNFSAHQDIISERLSTLHKLRSASSGILLVPIPTLMHRLPPTDYIAASSLVLEAGQALDIDRFRRDLSRNGYQHVETVFEHGEFAMRGSLFDIFPMGSNLPYRIDLLDDEVDSLRTFDPESQRTVDRVERINLLPGREYPMDKASISRFQMRWYDAFDVDPDQCHTYLEVSAGRSPGGCEYYLPLFFEQTATLFAYLPDGAAIIATGDHYQSAQQFWNEVGTRYEEYGIDPRRPLLPPKQCFTPVEELYQILGTFALLELRQNPDAPVHQTTQVKPPPQLVGETRQANPTDALAQFLEEHNAPVLLCAETAGRREILLESLQAHQLSPAKVHDWRDFIASGSEFAIATAPLDRGLYLGSDQPTLVCEAQLFGHRIAQRRRRKKAQDEQAIANVFRDINELREGVPVVHLEHGVGRYIGLQTLRVDEQQAEFLTLEYAEGSRLYVPVASLHLVSRYAGADADNAPLHRLGSDQWEKARRKASEKASDVAAQLLEVYARRETREGFAFGTHRQEYDEFAAAFPFEETPDQETTIAAVIADMESAKVMDRLVCGDVGFGKTEVAMRAAFLATRNVKQVAVLVPTTLLAQQHYNSFADRFADWGVNIAVVSRFRSSKEVAEISQRLNAGKIDILIGTHKLLQSDFHFSDLGLLIIDEEHRFGVKQKEAIKALRSEVDVLTLTATPIPRTLNMAIGGMRDLSIIATPPAKRL